MVASQSPRAVILSEAEGSTLASSCCIGPRSGQRPILSAVGPMRAGLVLHSRLWRQYPMYYRSRSVVQ